MNRLTDNIIFYVDVLLPQPLPKLRWLDIFVAIPCGPIEAKFPHFHHKRLEFDVVAIACGYREPGHETVAFLFIRKACHVHRAKSFSPERQRMTHETEVWHPLMHWIEVEVPGI